MSGTPSALSAAGQDTMAAARAKKRGRMEAAAAGAPITVTPGDRYGAGPARAANAGGAARLAKATAPAVSRPCRWFTGGRGSTDCTAEECAFAHTEKVARANLLRIGNQMADASTAVSAPAPSPRAPIPSDMTTGWLVAFDFTKGWGRLRPVGAANRIGTAARPLQKCDIFFHINSWVGKPSSRPVSPSDLPVPVMYKEVQSSRNPGKWEAVAVRRR